MYFITDPQYAQLSSTLVKQVAQMGGNLEGLVPPPVIRALRGRVKAKGEQVSLDRLRDKSVRFR